MPEIIQMDLFEKVILETQEIFKEIDYCEIAKKRLEFAETKSEGGQMEMEF